MATQETLQKFGAIGDLEKKKKAYRKQLGDLSQWRVMKNQVLVAVYIGTKFIPGLKVDLIRADMQEDIYQGSAGLLLKCGPTAFKENEKVNGKLVDEMERPKVNDWVLFVPGEGRRIQINGIDCRYFTEDAILGTTPSPDAITYLKS